MAEAPADSRHPGLILCAAHAGGYLPSYIGRFDRGCAVRPDLCCDGAHGGIEKAPSPRSTVKGCWKKSGSDGVSTTDSGRHSTEVEYLGEPPRARLQVFTDATKGILAHNDSPDNDKVASHQVEKK